MGKRLLLKAILVLAPMLKMFASDQTVVISKPSSVCTMANGSPVPATLDINNAASAIKGALNSDPDPKTYYMIHVATYNADASVNQQHWYVFYSGWAGKHSFLEWIEDTRIRHHFDEARIYGSKKVAVVYFERDIVAISQDEAIKRAKEARDAAAAADPIHTLKDEELSNLITLKAIKGDANAGGDKQAARFDLVNSVNSTKVAGFVPPGTTDSKQSYVMDAVFANFPFVTYTVDITKEVPAPIQDLQGIAGIVFGAQGAPQPLGIKVDGHITLCGGQAFDVNPLPSQMTVTAKVNGKDKPVEIGKNTYDNEKKYRYDFSFALPLKSYNDLTVDSTNLTLTAKKVEKQNLFGVVDISLIPYDTKKANFQLVPIFLYGLPITGHPLNHHLVAFGIGLNKVQMFAGIMVNHNHSVPNTAPLPPGTTNSTATGSGTVQDSWGAKFTYGINFPVSTVVNLLKKK